MGNTTGVTLSEDGRNVYVTNFNTDSVVSFAVEPDQHARLHRRRRSTPST